MTRDEALATLRASPLYLPKGEVHSATRAALEKLVTELEQAEELLDVLYDEIVERSGELKPLLDRIVFSRRAARRA